MPTQPVWAAPRAVAFAIAAYLLAHFAVRMWMGPTLGVDDAEQALFAQHWLPNYRFRAPPLFTWALLGLGEAIGVNVLSISLLRYALLAVICACVYLTARRLIRQPALAALATFSYAAIYVFGYYSHHDLTHTTVLSAGLAASWYVLVRLCETPTLPWYVLLGLCFGLGTLGKWNFAMFAVALPLACLLHPGFRHLVLSWRMIPAGLAAAAVAGPSALWALHVGPAPGDSTASLLGQASPGLLGGLVAGTAKLGLALLVYPLPFLALFLLVLGPAAWRGWLAAPAPASGPQRLPDTRLVGTSMAVCIGLYWLLVPLAGATHFPERLMQPALMVLPIYLFMLVERGGPVPERQVRTYAAVLAGVVAVAFLARVGIHLYGPDACGRTCRAFVPFEEVARGLRQAGFAGRGTIVAAGGYHTAGNLRIHFPDARVMETGYPARVWPAPRGEGQCLAFWAEGDDLPDRARARLRRYLAEELHVPDDASAREGTVAVLLQGSTVRHYRLFYRLYDRPQGECR